MARMDADRVRELLAYDPLTGEFQWKTRVAVGVAAGNRAGGVHPNGCVNIQIDGRKYKAHRLAWLHVNGVWPAGHVDHRNRVRSDNRITNLRVVTDGENSQNQGVRVTNRSGLQGVYPSGPKWRASIMVNKVRHQLGTFSTPEEAGAAYIEAKKALHPFS